MAGARAREAVARPSTDTVTDPGTRPEARGLQALADAISREWRPYRLRAYVVGVVAGILVGGIPTAIATTLVVFALSLAGLTIDPTVPWDELIWSAAFAVAFAAVGAWAVVRWLPPDFRAATETYIWLASEAEKHWREQFGSLFPVPRQRCELSWSRCRRRRRPPTSIPAFTWRSVTWRRRVARAS